MARPLQRSRIPTSATAKGNLAAAGMSSFPRRFDQHLADVYGYLAYRLGSRGAAEELTRVVFARAARKGVAEGAPPPEVRIALLAIARELAGIHPQATSPDRDHAGVSPELATALRQLGQRERSVLALRYGARLSGPEVARVLGLSEESVRRSLSRGLRRVRTQLEAQERGQGQQHQA